MEGKFDLNLSLCLMTYIETLTLYITITELYCTVPYSRLLFFLSSVIGVFCNIEDSFAKIKIECCENLDGKGMESLLESKLDKKE